MTSSLESAFTPLNSAWAGSIDCCWTCCFACTSASATALSAFSSAKVGSTTGCLLSVLSCAVSFLLSSTPSLTVFAFTASSEIGSAASISVSLLISGSFIWTASSTASIFFSTAFSAVLATIAVESTATTGSAVVVATVASCATEAWAVAIIALGTTVSAPDKSRWAGFSSTGCDAPFSDLLSSNDRWTTSGALCLGGATLTCKLTSLGFWWRTLVSLLVALSWLAAFCDDCCLVLLSAVRVSPRSSLPRELRWLCGLRLLRVCSVAAGDCASVVSLRSSFWRALFWRWLRPRPLSWLRFSCLSSVALLSVAVSATGSVWASVRTLADLLSVWRSSLATVSSRDSRRWCGFAALDLRCLRLLLSSALVSLSALLVSVALPFCVWTAWVLVVCSSWRLVAWLEGTTAAAWAVLNTSLLTCPNEPKLWAPVLTNASIAWAASQLLTLAVIWACGAWAKRLDNQATACGCAAATCATTGAGCAFWWLVWAALLWIGVSCVIAFCTARVDFTGSLLFLLWLFALAVFCAVLPFCSLLFCELSSLPWFGALRGWRVGCCSGRSLSAVCQSTS